MKENKISQQTKLLACLYLAEKGRVDQGRLFLAEDLLRKIVGKNYFFLISRAGRLKYVEKSHLLAGKGYRLTYLGKNYLLNHAPTLNFFSPAITTDPGSSGVRSLVFSKRLTLVALSLPESHRPLRDRLRYSLNSLGFGRINRGLYCSPHLSLKEATNLTRDLGVQEFAQVFTADFPLDFLSRGKVAGWDLSYLADLYERALAAPEDTFRFFDYFLKAFVRDPFLPSGWLGENWVGFKASLLTRSLLSSTLG